jgi:hypothetical protein
VGDRGSDPGVPVLAPAQNRCGALLAYAEKLGDSTSPRSFFGATCLQYQDPGTSGIVAEAVHTLHEVMSPSSQVPSVPTVNTGMACPSTKDTEM